MNLKELHVSELCKDCLQAKVLFGQKHKQLKHMIVHLYVAFTLRHACYRASIRMLLHSQHVYMHVVSTLYAHVHVCVCMCMCVCPTYMDIYVHSYNCV